MKSYIFLNLIFFCQLISPYFTMLSPSNPPNPIFLDLVSPFKWSQRKLKGMFHDLSSLHKNHVCFSITSIVSLNVSLVHWPLITTMGTLLTFGFFRVCVSIIDGIFSFSVSQSNMLLHHLQSIIKFITSSLLLVPTSKELGVHMLVQQVVGLQPPFFLNTTQEMRK